MPTADRPPRRFGMGSLLLLVAVLLLAGPTAAWGQVDYTGLPSSPPPAETYVVTYVGPPSGGFSAAQRSPGAGTRGAAVSVTEAAVGAAPGSAEEGEGRLVTGWDLVTIAALGLTAVVAFAVSAARFRSN